MEPKFQSTFIPKSPISSSAPVSLMGQRTKKERPFLGFIAGMVFTVAFILAVGVVGYRYYLNYAITQMAAALEAGRAQLQPDTVNELIRLNNRIVSTGSLIGGHVMLSPLFRFLEVNTLKSVRFNHFNYAMTSAGLELTLKGEARSYSALAQQADLLQRSKNLDKVVFSDLQLSDKGNVLFSVKGLVDPKLLSYQTTVESITLPPLTSPIISTSTPRTATSTGATATSSSPN